MMQTDTEKRIYAIKSVVLTQARIDMGDIEVIVSEQRGGYELRKKQNTILNVLMDCGYIEPYHAEYGLTFSMLRDVWLGNLGAKAAMLSDSIAVACNRDVSPKALYDAIYRITKPRNAKVVLWAVEAPESPITALEGSACRQAFDILAGAFVEANKTVEKRLENLYGEKG